jgi:hypothetical protein
MKASLARAWTRATTLLPLSRKNLGVRYGFQRYSAEAEESLGKLPGGLDE